MENLTQPARTAGTVSTARADRFVTGRTRQVNGKTLYEPEFSPRAKHPVYEVEVNLATEAAFRVFQSTYDPVQKALYHLFSTIPIMLRQEQEMVNEVHGVIEKRFSELESLQNDELERLRHLAKTDGVDLPARYYNEEPMVVVVLTPQMTRYLSLVNNMDQIIRLIDALWFGMRIRQTERNQKMLEWRNRIVRFHRELNAIHLRMINAIQRKNTKAATQPNGKSAPAETETNGQDAETASSKVGKGTRAKKASSGKKTASKANGTAAQALDVEAEASSSLADLGEEEANAEDLPAAAVH